MKAKPRHVHDSQVRRPGDAARKGVDQAAALIVYAVSGGTGRTAQFVVEAALSQFDNPAVKVEIRPRTRTAQAARDVVQEAARSGGVICHTLVAPPVRRALIQEAERQAVPTFDPLGPMLSLLGDRLKTAPRNVPGLHYELQKEQFDRIDAVDYTITHDDGRGLKDLPRADVVIVGVSRASKSVTCFFLAARGVRAANVPLIPGHAVPRELLKLPTRKVVGLTMNAQRLVAIRQMRLERTGESQPYIDLKQVVEELRFASHAMAQHGWRCIDVSYKAVEEVAAEVIEVLRRGTG